MAPRYWYTKRVGSSTVTVIPGAEHRLDEMGRPITGYSKCGHCGRIWDDEAITGVTPAPSARCPFEYSHHYPQSETEHDRVLSNPLPRSNAGRYRRRRRAARTHATAVRRARKGR